MTAHHQPSSEQRLEELAKAATRAAQALAEEHKKIKVGEQEREELNHYYRILEEYPGLCKELNPPASTKRKHGELVAGLKKKKSRRKGKN